MQLKEWLKKNKKSKKQFAEEFNWNYEDVRRYCVGDVIPRSDRMQKILEVTEGKVTPNDFYVKERTV